MTIKEWLGNENALGQDIWSKKYRNNNETFGEWLDRVSGDNQELRQLIFEKKFLFGGRALANRGLNNGSYFNCYSSGYCPDDFAGIMQLNSNLGLTYKAQGGQGVSLSKLRPKGTPIGNRYKSDGIIPFLELFNKTTEITSQAGSRKGALLVSLDIRHKQAEEFITIKTSENSINKANLSLEIDDEFMNAVETYYKTGEVITLHEVEEYSGHIVEYDVIPIKLYQLMMQCAYDWAEPGCIFTNEFRNYNLMEFDDDYQVETCNPSLRKGTEVLTENGIFPIEQLEGKDFKVYNLHEKLVPAKCFLSGKNKQLYKITLDNYKEYYCTPEHKWAIKTDVGYQKVTADELKIGNLLPLTSSSKLSNGTKGIYDDGLFFGLWYGDGCVTLRKDDGVNQYGLTFGSEDKENGILSFVTSYLSKITNKDVKYCTRNRGGQNWYEICCRDIKLRKHFEDFKVIDKLNFPDDFYTNKSEDFRRGFVDGLISSDGTVNTTKKGEGIIFTTSKENVAKQFHDLMFWYGIKCSIQKCKRRINFNNKGEKTYTRYDVQIGRGGIQSFIKLFNLSHKNKQLKVESLPPLQRYVVANNHVKVTNVELTNIKEDVWDIHVYDNSHTFRLNYCITGNCGEQPLARNFCCNLGSINLSEFVINEYTDKATINYSALRKAIQISINALDVLVDENLPNHPLDEQRENSKNYRNIGLGLMGVSTALFKLKLKYGSKESQDFIEKVFKFMFKEAVLASSNLAKEKGRFPKYKECVFDSRIIKAHFNKEEIKSLKKVGLRNCSLLSIAPNGSISSLLGVTGGCEPEFAIKYTRRTDNLKESYDVFCKEAQYYMDKFNTTLLPDYFVCSADINWKDRVDMQSIMQKHVDTAISSTVNLPNSATVEDIESLYLYAWEKGLKGITIYRDGCKRSGILTTDETPDGKAELVENKTAKYNTIMPISRKAIGTTDGNTYCKKCACGTLYITINNTNNGDIVESFVNTSKGGICQANIGAVNRMISLALRSGVKVSEVVDQLKGITCPACIKNRSEVDGISCPDIISRTIEEHKKNSNHRVLKNNPTTQYVSKDSASSSVGLTECPECRNVTLKPEGGCNTCIECGWSRCG